MRFVFICIFAALFPTARRERLMPCKIRCVGRYAFFDFVDYYYDCDTDSLSPREAICWGTRVTVGASLRGTKQSADIERDCFTAFAMTGRRGVRVFNPHSPLGPSS